MRCEFGFCLVCEKEIAPKCDSCKSGRRPGPEYTEVQIKWTNGSLMTTAVCIDCAKGPIWSADKKAMTEATWQAWDKTNANYSKDVVIA